MVKVTLWLRLTENLPSHGCLLGKFQGHQQGGVAGTRPFEQLVEEGHLEQAGTATQYK